LNNCVLAGCTILHIIILDVNKG